MAIENAHWEWNFFNGYLSYIVIENDISDVRIILHNTCVGILSLNHNLRINHKKEIYYIHQWASINTYIHT